MPSSRRMVAITSGTETSPRYRPPGRRGVSSSLFVIAIQEHPGCSDDTSASDLPSRHDPAGSRSSAFPRDTDAVAGPPMVERQFFEEQVMATGSFGPVGQGGGVVSVVGKDDRILAQI